MSLLLLNHILLGASKVSQLWNNLICYPLYSFKHIYILFIVYTPSMYIKQMNI